TAGARLRNGPAYATRGSGSGPRPADRWAPRKNATDRHRAVAADSPATPRSTARRPRGRDGLALGVMVASGLLQPFEAALGHGAAVEIEPGPRRRRGRVLPQAQGQAEGDLRLVHVALLQGQQAPQHGRVRLL